MVSIVKSKGPLSEAEPAWDIARLFPPQGYWDDADYLALDTNHLVELTDGVIEVLSIPKPAHQRIVVFLCDTLRQATRPAKLGEALPAPMRIQLRPGKFREPDLMFMLTANASKKRDDYWEGADLVMEVVSDDPESRERDYTRKRADYAEAGIAEYWIIDPQEKRILVLKLHRGEYLAHGEFVAGQIATSPLLPDFSIAVDETLGAAVAP